MQRASQRPLRSTPEEVDDFKTLMERFGIEYVRIGEYVEWYNPQFMTRNQAIKKLRETVEADTSFPCNSNG